VVIDSVEPGQNLTVDSRVYSHRDTGEFTQPATQAAVSGKFGLASQTFVDVAPCRHRQQLDVTVFGEHIGDRAAGSKLMRHWFAHSLPARETLVREADVVPCEA